MNKCQQKARVDVLQHRGTTSLGMLQVTFDSEVSHVAMHSFSSNIYTNMSINNSEVPAALSLQKGLLTGSNML